MDRLQRLHDKINEFDELVQGWNNALALEGHPLAERYKRNGLTIICNFEMLVPLKWSGSSVRGNDQPLGNKDPAHQASPGWSPRYW